METTEGSLAIGTEVDYLAQEMVSCPRWQRRSARLVSDVFSPPVLGAAGALAIIWPVADRTTWRWLAFVLLATIVPSIAYITYLMKKQLVTDFHIPVRSQRIRPMMMTSACILMVWVTALFGKPPHVIIGLLISGSLLFVTMFMITLRWKISAHAAAAGACATLCWFSATPLGAPAIVLVPIVIWARLRLKRHTFWQTMAGLMLGSVASLVLALY